MTAKDYFSKAYDAARGGFLAACRAAGAALERHESLVTGPKGQALFTDVAWLCPDTAKRVLITLSATHGVEGFCGSALQRGWLESGLHKEMPAGTALLQIHAVT